MHDGSVVDHGAGLAGGHDMVRSRDDAKEWVGYPLVHPLISEVDGRMSVPELTRPALGDGDRGGQRYEAAGGSVSGLIVAVGPAQAESYLVPALSSQAPGGGSTAVHIACGSFVPCGFGRERRR